MTSKQKENKVEATGSKAKEILDNFKKGDNTRFPTMDELRAIFIKENIHFTDEDFKNNSSGIINGKYKISSTVFISPSYNTIPLLTVFLNVSLNFLSDFNVILSPDLTSKGVIFLFWIVKKSISIIVLCVFSSLFS